MNLKTIAVALAAMLAIVRLMAHVAGGAGSIDAAALANQEYWRTVSVSVPDAFVVRDDYLLPELPGSVLDELPAATATSDHYRSERIAIADLVIGEQTLAAEDLAATYAAALPGFARVLHADGFSQDAEGTWFYDRYQSWMRFPLAR